MSRNNSLSAKPKAALVVLLAGFLSAGSVRGEPPAIQLLRLQQVGDTTYFRVRLAVPDDMQVPEILPGPYGEWERRRLALSPRLVPQDDKASAVYQRLDLPHFQPTVEFQQRNRVPVKGLEFVGKLPQTGKARFLLLYPTAEKDKALAGIKDKELAQLLRPVRWAEVPVELDFKSAKEIPQFNKGEKNLNLETLWAEAQAARLAILEAQAPEFGFYGFACAATGRKYSVPDPVLEGDRKKGEEQIHRRMLDLTTGTMAITQSLALKRLRDTGPRGHLERTIDIAKVPGITIADHPWKKMMEGRKAVAEPLAKLVPHDNYYIRFKDFTKFTEFQDFLEEWGTPAGRAYEVQSREYGLKQRYEKQLCLKSTWLGRKFGSFLVKSVAITGSDPFVREGSDVTVLFHIVNREAFLAGVNPFIKEAKKEFGDRLTEKKSLYREIPIESFVTPLREVSVHRAAVDEFVVYSNSPAGLRRVLDTFKGGKSLWQALDFQYMRTVFKADDKEEDGFAFLSDAFIRQLVGPASKIKEMRRLEALTSLSMLTHGALFHAWEKGKLPADHQALLDAAGLIPEHLYQPEGRKIDWNAKRQVAVSDAYNTIHFATPLIELPISKITAFEEQTYRDFREEYQRLWRQFFDPVGIRFALNKKQVKLEVYILPMINNQDYNRLQQITGFTTTPLDPARISPRSLLQFHMSFRDFGWFKSVGGWTQIRLDDSKNLARLGEWWMRNDLLPLKDREQHADESLRLAFQLPITAGIGIRDKTEFPKDKEQITSLLKGFLGPVKIKEGKYKGTVITRAKFGRDSQLVQQVNRNVKGKLTKVVLYHAVIEDGWYAGFDKGALLDMIDRAEERKKQKAGKGETVPVNASLHLSPRSAQQSLAAVQQYLEWETHKRALPNDALWYTLYRTGLIDGKTPEKDKRAAALQFLGFIPVSPDDAPYKFDAARDEMVNQRHGSLRQPRLHESIADNSPLTALLTQFPSLRIDLRYREDGFHSIITVERKGK